MVQVPLLQLPPEIYNRDVWYLQIYDWILSPPCHLFKNSRNQWFDNQWLRDSFNLNIQSPNKKTHLFLKQSTSPYNWGSLGIRFDVTPSHWPFFFSNFSTFYTTFPKFSSGFTKKPRICWAETGWGPENVFTCQELWCTICWGRVRGFGGSC